MKIIKTIFTAMFLLLAITTTKAQSTDIEKVWLEHDVMQSGEKGIKIHVKFSVNRMMNQSGKCGAWFFYDDKTPIKGVSNKEYATTAGDLATSESFTPKYEISNFKDVTMFLPFSVLKQASNRIGNYEVYFNVGILDNNGKRIGSSTNHSFNFSSNNANNSKFWA